MNGRSTMGRPLALPASVLVSSVAPLGPAEPVAPS
ncbi:MAG: hypothetical protein K0R44_2593 [Thermomicrobiales bacterium]|jgi:hypothetical protein|nr:hypothetical protein [Thermomicrobiales bacterium]